MGEDGAEHERDRLPEKTIVSPDIVVETPGRQYYKLPPHSEISLSIVTPVDVRFADKHLVRFSLRSKLAQAGLTVINRTENDISLLNLSRSDVIIPPHCSLGRLYIASLPLTDTELVALNPQLSQWLQEHATTENGVYYNVPVVRFAQPTAREVKLEDVLKSPYTDRAQLDHMLGLKWNATPIGGLGEFVVGETSPVPELKCYGQIAAGRTESGGLAAESRLIDPGFGEGKGMPIRTEFLNLKPSAQETVTISFHV